MDCPLNKTWIEYLTKRKPEQGFTGCFLGAVVKYNHAVTSAVCRVFEVSIQRNRVPRDEKSNLR